MQSIEIRCRRSSIHHPVHKEPESRTFDRYGQSDSPLPPSALGGGAAIVSSSRLAARAARLAAKRSRAASPLARLLARCSLRAVGRAERERLTLGPWPKRGPGRPRSAPCGNRSGHFSETAAVAPVAELRKLRAAGSRRSVWDRRAAGPEAKPLSALHLRERSPLFGYPRRRVSPGSARWPEAGCRVPPPRSSAAAASVCACPSGSGGRAAQGPHGSSGDVDGLHDELARRHGDELDPVLVGEAFSHARSKRLAAASGISGALASISSRRAATSSTVAAEASFAVPQHPGVGVGDVLLGQVGMAGDVHGDVGKRRRQLA